MLQTFHALLKKNEIDCVPRGKAFSFLLRRLKETHPRNRDLQDHDTVILSHRQDES